MLSDVASKLVKSDKMFSSPRINIAPVLTIYTCTATQQGNAIAKLYILWK